MNKQYKTSEHLVYLCRYHVIFCPKYRRRIFVDGIDVRTKQIFFNTAKAHDFQILEMEVMPDHVHLLIECDPRYGIMQCVKDLKRESSYILIREFPSIRKRIPCLWTRSCFIATVGSVSLETVKEYINSQKGK